MIEQLSLGAGMACGLILMVVFPKFLQTPPEKPAASVSPVVLTIQRQPDPTILVVSLSKAAVQVKSGDDIIATYPVAVGRAGWETPQGRFQVTDMKVNPAWKSPFTGRVHPPSSSNPIGDRWIGFASTPKGVVGFHGTPVESSVGQPVSSGCLRMRRADLHALYSQVSIGTPVIVEQ